MRGGECDEKESYLFQVFPGTNATKRCPCFCYLPSIFPRYKCYKKMSMFLVIGGTLDWIGFTLVFLFTDRTSLMFVLYTMFGFFVIPLQSVGVEQGSVTTYPVPEEISAGLMLVLGNFYGFVMVLCFGGWIAGGRSALVCWVNVGVLCVACVCVCWSKVVVKRGHGEGEGDGAGKADGGGGTGRRNGKRLDTM